MIVFKYQVPVDGLWHEIELPYTAPILHVGTQGERFDLVTFWAEVGDRKPVKRLFSVFGTGESFTPKSGSQYHHRGSTQADEFVWHLYEMRVRSI